MGELTKLERQMKAAAREFARGEFDKDALLKMSRARTFPRKILKKAGNTGLIGVHLSGEHGGGGGTIAEQAVVFEELAAHDSTAGFALASAAFGLELVGAFGEPDLKAEMIGPVCAGEKVCTTAFYETDVQVSFPKFETQTEKTDKGWRINGTKTNVLNGGLADYFILICRDNQNGTMFLVDKETGGIEVRDQGPRLGMEMVCASTINFTNTSVPDSRIIGDAGKAMDQLKIFQCGHWILTAALALGTAKGAFKRALNYIRQREQFGKPIGAFRVSQNKIGDMGLKIELTGLALRQATLSYDAGKHKIELSAMAKLCATRTAVEVSDKAVQLLGGYGYMTEYEVEHFLRDAKALDLMAGEKTLLMDIISENKMGKR